MSWPNKIYVATKTLGVYYTNNFSSPSTQPKWVTVNGGLPATDVRQFALDPHDNDGRQYLLLEASRTLYRRELGGNWTAILAPADVDTLLATTSCTIANFCCDPSIPGRLWASVGSNDLAVPADGYWAIYSDDYGDSWNVTTKAITGWGTRGLGQVRAYGDNVWFAVCVGSGGEGHILTSADKGATWTFGDNMGGSSWVPTVHLNSLFTSKVYANGNGGFGGPDLVQMQAGTQTLLQAGLGPTRDDCMWFSPSAADVQRLIKNNRIYVTDDEWDTVNTPSECAPAPVSVAIWSGDNEDQMILGLSLYANAHAIGVVTSPSETTPVGIAGASPATSPYTDSIPNTCGGVANGGIAAVEETPSEGPTPPPGGIITPPGGTPIMLGGSANVNAVSMPGYTGTARGEPLPGDRGAWAVDTDAHAKLHASDILAAAPTRHNPAPGAAGTVPMSDGTKYVSADVLTPTEHTAIGNDAPHHAPVTLGIGSDAALALSGQELILTLPTLGDHDHSGDAGDGGAFDAANLSSGTATDGQVLTADGAGGAAWENPPAGGAVDAADVTYTPAVAADWDSDTDPGNADDALDQLAARVDDLETAGGGAITVEEIDGTPSVANVSKIKVTNGTLTDNTGGTVTLDFGSAATDGAAIHDNEAGEIHAITSKSTPANADELVIEDSEDSWNKKRVAISALPSGSGGGVGILELQVFS